VDLHLYRVHVVIVYSAAKSNAKKVSLELGGKSPLIIFSDCDVDRAVRYVSRPPQFVRSAPLTKRMTSDLLTYC